VRRPGRGRVDTSELRETWQPRLWFRLIALVAVLGFATAFVLENRRSVSVHFVVATADVSLIWLVLLALALGVAGGILLAQLERRRRRRRQKPRETADAVRDLGGRDEAERQAE
jgi:uncharacterized integral membrane protein